MTRLQLPKTTLRLGTRASQLALWQANFVRDELIAQWGTGLAVNIVKISTQGDTDKETPLAELGGKGVFVKAIEQALLDDEIDLAVHSMKDLPSKLPDGLSISCVPARADARDALVGTEPGVALSKLPKGTRLGTGSLRRAALARRANAHLKIIPIRGNVPTRVKKVESGEVDAVLLAAAGLTRLGMEDKISTHLDPERFIPAACQGLLALQTRTDDTGSVSLLQPLANETATVEAAVERAFLAELGVGCNVPLGCHAQMIAPDVVTAGAVIIDPSGRPCFMANRLGHPAKAGRLGAELAQTLLRLGAGQVLEAVDSAA